MTNHNITRCQADINPRGWTCDEAFDGVTNNNNGWNNYGTIPAWAVFYPVRPVSVNTVIFKTGAERNDRHLTDFTIEVQINQLFIPIHGIAVNVGATIEGGRVKITDDGVGEVRVAFDVMTNVTAVRITVYGSDAKSDQSNYSILNELVILCMKDTGLFWEADVDVIINQI